MLDAKQGFFWFYVNSWGRGKTKKVMDRVGARAPARFLCVTMKYPNAKLLQKLAHKDGFEPKIYAKYMSPWLFLFAFVFLSLTIFFATDYAWIPFLAYILLGGYTIFALLALHADRLHRKTEASLTNDAENKKK